jgi:hypothetical protein
MRRIAAAAAVVVGMGALAASSAGGSPVGLKPVENEEDAA